MAPRRLGLLGVAAAGIGAALALRRGLRTLDRADAELDIDDSDFTFPAGRLVEVTTDDGATIATEMAGQGPVVVLVHGITSSRHDWGLAARRLIELGHTVVGVDQRGHGESSAGSEGYSTARLGADLAQVLTSLELTDVVLAGHSMGGIAAMSFAVDHPAVCAERVRSLVLVATTPRTPRLFRHPQTRLVEAVLGQARFDLVIRRPALATVLFGRFGSTRLVAAARASALRADPGAVARCAAGIAGYDITERLASIDVTTHCIYGSRDLVTTAKANARIADTIPGATALEIEGAGHLLIWTHVDAITTLVTS